jgi:hypothetical protein
MYTTVREVRRYRAVMPPEAWKNGREPRERRRKRDALDDLIAGLRGYLERRPPDEVTVEWVTWAAMLGAVKASVGPAPDMSEWWITTRVEWR